MDVIEKEFGKRAIIRGGIYLFQPSDAIEVIHKCKELGLNILGVDSFKITSNSTQPQDSLDCSYNAKEEGNWAKAIKFIQQKDNGLVFEIVYE